MTDIRLATLVGNPKPQSRTLQLAVDVTQHLGHALNGHAHDQLVVDLATSASRVHDWGDEGMNDLVAGIRACQVVVCASPVYKATYTGLLKSFLDRLPTNGLEGVVAIPVMMGGAMNHSMAPDAYLRPLLVELGATVPTRSLYVLDSEIERSGEQIAAWAQVALPRIAACARG